MSKTPKEGYVYHHEAEIERINALDNKIINWRQSEYADLNDALREIEEEITAINEPLYYVARQLVLSQSSRELSQFNNEELNRIHDKYRNAKKYLKKLYEELQGEIEKKRKKPHTKEWLSLVTVSTFASGFIIGIYDGFFKNNNSLLKRALHCNLSNLTCGLIFAMALAACYFIVLMSIICATKESKSTFRNVIKVNLGLSTIFALLLTLDSAANILRSTEPLGKDAMGLIIAATVIACATFLASCYFMYKDDQEDKMRAIVATYA